MMTSTQRMPVGEGGPPERVPAAIAAAQRLVVEGVRERLLGLLVNADDALFELAARCVHDDDRRRCFDLARALRQHRNGLIENFCRAMNRADRMWLKRDFRAHMDDQAWIEARRLGNNVRLHFGPLLSSVAAHVGRLLDVDIEDPEALPISPTCVGAAYLESRAQIVAEHPEAAAYMDGLFVRYVVDRLGRLYGDALEVLVSDAGGEGAERQLP